MIPLSLNALALLTSTLSLLHHINPINAHPQFNQALPASHSNFFDSRQFPVPTPPACCSAAASLITDGDISPGVIQAAIDECYRPGGCAFSLLSGVPSTVGPTPTPTPTGYVNAPLPPMATGGAPSDGDTGTGTSDYGSGPYSNATVISSGLNATNATSGDAATGPLPIPPLPAQNETAGGAEPRASHGWKRAAGGRFQGE